MLSYNKMSVRYVYHKYQTKQIWNVVIFTVCNVCKSGLAIQHAVHTVELKFFSSIAMGRYTKWLRKSLCMSPVMIRWWIGYVIVAVIQRRGISSWFAITVGLMLATLSVTRLWEGLNLRESGTAISVDHDSFSDNKVLFF